MNRSRSALRDRSSVLTILSLLCLAVACRAPQVSRSTDTAPPPVTPPPWPPTFAEYPTTDTMVGGAAPIDYTFDPDARRFRTTLDDARKGPADLAGHYEFVVWGCGTQCTSHLILDLRSGRTYDDTLVNFSCEQVEHHRESALVIAVPDTDPEVAQSCPALPTRYFVWSGTALEELHPDPSQQGPLAPVSVTDSVIRIPLKNGAVITLVSNPNAEGDLRQYSYDGHFKHAPFHGVGVSYYEAIEYYLIHDSTGRRFRLADQPVESPSGREFVVASMGLDSDIQGNSLSIVRVQGDSIVDEWGTVMLTEWGAEHPVWAGDDTIHFTRVWAADERKAIPETPATLIRTAKGWTIRGVVPDTLPEDTTETH